MPVYYSLDVLRAQGVVWKSGPIIPHHKLPSLYVEVSIDDKVQKTNTKEKTKTPSWRETLPLSCPTASSGLVSINLKHKSSYRDETVGYIKIEFTKLLKACEDGETELRLRPSDGDRFSETTGIVVLRLSTSDAKANAELALQNLVRDIAQGPLAASSSKEMIVSKAEELAKDGKTAIQSNLFQSFADTIPTIDNFVAVMDKITEANPYLKVAWYTTSALYKIVSNQIKADKKVRGLVEGLAMAFSFVRDVEHLRDILQSFEATITRLLDVITECCLLLRKYALRSFASRSLSTDDKQKIDELANSLDSLKDDLNAGFIRQTAKITEHVSEQVDLLRFFQELGLSQKDDMRAFDRPSCLKGTRTAIQGQIKEWISSDTSQNIFWVNGVAGSGKSTIATTIADDVRSSSLGAYIFFERGKSEPSSVIRTIAYRLAASNNSIASRISVACKGVDIASTTAAKEFEILLQNPLTSSDDVSGPVVIILDALDECGAPQGRYNLMRLLKDEFPKLPSKFRFLITSRPEDDIVRALSRKPHVVEVELDYNSEDTRRDVHTYIDHAMRDAVTEEVPEDWAWDANMKILGDAANGLFIWASTAVKLVSRTTLQILYLKKLVSNANSLSLDELYATALRDTLSWDDVTKSIFSKVLSLILYGKKPLSDKTIDGILGLDSDTSSSIILSKLRSLVAYERGKPIHLHHTSFNDYLTSNANRSDPWYIDVTSQKQMIASQCFDVMAKLLRFNICDLKTSFLRNDEVTGLDVQIKRNIPPHLEYACLFWAQHLRDAPFSLDSDDESNLLKKLSTFVYDRLLYWFEILSLTKNVYHYAGQALQDAKAWTPIDQLDLSAFLKQAYKLANNFAFPISESAPHIYVSMVPLTKEESNVSAHYANQISSMVLVERKGTKPLTALLKVFEGHTHSVFSVAFSPDGKRIVSGSLDTTIRVWDAESGKLVSNPFEGHTNSVLSVAFSPDGNRVVSGSHDGTIRVWDAESGKLVSGPFEGHMNSSVPHYNSVTSVAFSPDGNRLVSGSHDGTIRLWDTESGKPVSGPFEGHMSDVSLVAFLPDGKHIVSCSDGVIRVWDAKSGTVFLGPFEGHTSGISSVALSPDGKHIVSGSVDGIRVWDAERGTIVSGPFGGHVSLVAFSPDGNRIVSDLEAQAIQVCVWDAESGKLISGPFEGHTDVIRSVAFSPDGKQVISGSQDNTIRVWDAESDTLVSGPFEGHTVDVNSVAFSPDGNRIVSGSWETIRVWEAESGKLVLGPFKGHTNNITSVSFSPDGNRIVSGSYGGMIQVWDADSGELVSDLHEEAVDVVWSVTDGKHVLSYSDGRTIQVWDAESGTVISGPFEEHVFDTFEPVAFSPDGKRIVFSSWDDTIRVWDVESGKTVSELFKRNSSFDEVLSVVFSPDGKRVSGSLDNTIRIWDVESGKLVSNPFEGHTDGVLSVAFSPDGNRVVSGSYDKTILVWDAENGTVVSGPFEGHTDDIKSVAFSPDGKRIVSGSSDRTIRVWNAESGMVVSSPSEGHTNTILPVAFSPVGSRDDVIRASNVDNGNVLSMSDEVNINSSWVISEDGWILGKQQELLLWIPPDVRPTLWRPQNTAVFSCPFSTRLNFMNHSLGENWHRCLNS